MSQQAPRLIVAAILTATWPLVGSPGTMAQQASQPKIVAHGQSATDIAALQAAARGRAPLGGRTKISAPMIAGGDVTSFGVSPDGANVIYLADRDVNDVIELFRVPISGGAATQLNPNFLGPPVRDVLSFQISPDSSRVIYMADQDADELVELFSVPIAGGAAVQLNGVLVAGGDVLSFQISPDSSRVVYMADQDIDQTVELFSVPIAGGIVTQLNGVLSVMGDVADFSFNDTGTRVLYRADQVTDSVLELYSVPVAGGAATKLNANPAFGFGVLAYGASHGRAFYVSPQDTIDVRELYSLPEAGGARVKLNGPLTAGGDVFGLSIGVARVAYTADQDTDGVIEAYSVPTTGGPVVKLNPPLPASCAVDFAYDSDGDVTAFFGGNVDTPGVYELFSVPAAGGATTQLNAPMVAGGDVTAWGFLPSDPQPDMLAYVADQDTDEVREIYGQIYPSGAPVKLNGPLVAGGDVVSGSFWNTGALAYLADQDTDSVTELYFSSITGVGPVTKLNGPLVAGGDVVEERLTPSDVVYLADQDTNDVFELYRAALDGDADGDAVADGLDCLVYDAGVWGIPGEATALMLSHTGGVGGTTTLFWTAPSSGGTAFVYDTVRTSIRSDFQTIAICVESDDGPNTTATDTDTPASGGAFYYLVRAANPCGSGLLGGVNGTGRSCP
jgi:hypothetical protein